MKKQDIYIELFMWGLPYIRNIQSQSYFQKGKDKSCYYVAELLHNLYVSMFDKNFTSHDIWFINVQAKYFIENCNTKIFIHYPMFCDLLLLLLDIVPKNQKEQIQWTPSKEILELIVEYRKKQKN